MAADRGAFIDQSQSFNVHMVDANFGKLTSLHFYAWKKGLKTGMYYLRTRAAADAIKFTVDQNALKDATNKKLDAGANENQEPDEKKMAAMVCSLTNRDDCLMCGA
eukprot:2067304-Pyramimonas_sp.AAC.2